MTLANDLVVRARALAAKSGTTFCAVVEGGLRMALEGDRVETQYRLPYKSVPGRGLHRQASEIASKNGKRILYLAIASTVW